MSSGSVRVGGFGQFVEVAVAALAGAGAALLLWLRRRSGRAAGPPDGLEADGLALLLEDDAVVGATPEAQAALGAEGPATARLAGFFGAQGEVAAEQLAQARRTGHAARRVLRGADGRLYELRTRPRGGLLRVDIRDGAAFEAALAAPAPDSPAPPREDDALRTTAEGLAEAGALILWQGPTGGAPSWAAGRVRLAAGEVEASEVVALMGARRARSEAPEPPLDGPRAGRLEARRGGEALPLTAVEVDRPDGLRLGYAVDASAMDKAERSLSRFVQTMTETFAHLTVGLAIFDRNRELALFNPAIVNMWQLDPAWLARNPGMRDILDRLRAARRAPEARDHRAWRDEILRLFDDADGAEYEELWTLADGTTMRVLARPHPHGSLAFVFDDVTERMRLEQRNRHMDDLINSTLEHLDEGLAVFAPDGTLQFVNAAFHEIWNTDAETVGLEMHASDLCTLCSRLTVETEVWDRLVTFATGEETRSAWAARLSLGSGRMLAARFAPLPDGSTMALFSDVTDSERIATALRERNEALEAAEQMRSAVLDQISHRLRTPLNTIFGFGELLANTRSGSLTELQNHYVSGILEAASQLLDTISAVTELASLQIDPLEGEDGPAGVEEVLATTASLLETRAAERGVALQVEFDGAIGVLAGNPVRLRQIVFNLATDAIHRCPAEGRVTLSGRRGEDGTVEIVTEEAHPPEAEARDPRLGRFPESTAMLPLVRRLVAQEGGELEILRDPAAGATRVLCRFPDREDPPARAAEGG